MAWGKEIFEKLHNGQPEQLVSRFDVTHGMLLNVLSRSEEDGCRAMQRLIHDCHEAVGTRRRLGKKAFVLFRSLVERQIIEFNPLRVNVDLQEDFSLNHALSLYLLDTVTLLDPQDPDYALDALTLVESILENPEMVLRKQLDRIKGDKIGELKAQGMDFDERMEELEKLEIPSPSASSFTRLSTRSRPSTPGSGRRISALNRSRARCSRTSTRFPNTSGITACSAPRASCFVIYPMCIKRSCRTCPKWPKTRLPTTSCGSSRSFWHR